ncbi:hypothetical protein M426DRAFT_221345 [Hypoxylon sp. CI-4A]|nr:hypothetical protein M426DRAFT_221345 [Hypoxylon sp. CI-4A]
MIYLRISLLSFSPATLYVPSPSLSTPCLFRNDEPGGPSWIPSRSKSPKDSIRGRATLWRAGYRAVAHIVGRKVASRISSAYLVGHTLSTTAVLSTVLNNA